MKLPFNEGAPPSRSISHATAEVSVVADSSPTPPTNIHRHLRKAAGAKSADVLPTFLNNNPRSLRPASLCSLVLNLRVSFRQRKRRPVCPNPAHNNNKGQPWQPSIPYELLLLPYRQL